MYTLPTAYHCYKTCCVQTDKLTDQQTDIATYRAAIAAQKTTECSNDLNFTIRNKINALTAA